MLSFEEGYNSFIRLFGTNIGAQGGATYVSQVEKTIGEIDKAFNQDLRFTEQGEIIQTSIKKLKGNAAEFWHAYTHNIDAAVKGVGARAEVVSSHVVGSVDVQGNWEDSGYGLKYYKSAKESAKAQAEIYRAKYEQWASKYRNEGIEPPPANKYFSDEYNKYLTECAKANRTPQSFDEVFPGVDDLNNPLYLGQFRLIPKDQLKGAQKYLNRWLAEESNGGRAEQAKRYKDALDNLTDRIKSNEGSESIPLSIEEAEELAQLAKDGNFDPAEWGLTTEDLISAEYVMSQAFKSGLSAALISVVMKVGPEICSAICRLIKNGEIDVEDFKRVGIAAANGGAEGYIRGTIAATVTISCKAGHLGSVLKSANPSIIGAIIAVAMNTAQNACLMSFGKMSKHEFAEHCTQDLIATGFALGLGVAGGAAAAALFTPAATVFGYMIGSFVGSVVGSFVHKGIYSCAISFCVENGSTFFGLVDQNYALPPNVLKEIGFRVFEYETLKINRVEQKALKFRKFEDCMLEPLKLDITYLRRGVIGVGAIGYI
jgi:hypothetical protein